MIVPDAVYKAGDLITIRLTEEAAYDLGCGTTAVRKFNRNDVIVHRCAPQPFYRYLYIGLNGDTTINSVINTISVAKYKENLLAYVKLTIDASKPNGQRVTVQELS